MQEFDALKDLVGDAEVELMKVEQGNKAAGTRLRKKMQEIKKQCQVVRDKIMELRKGGDAQTDAPDAPAA